MGVSLLAQNGGPATLNPLLPLVIIAVLFYFMLIRPERRKRQEMDRLVANLKKNDRVVTSGGILGTVVNVSPESEELTLKVDESTNTKLRVLRHAIVRVLPAESGGEKLEDG